LKRHRKPPTTLLALLALLACVLPLAACTGYGKPNRPSTELAFGVDMARRGLWSEALFRFHAAERADPQNPRVQNNLGVAYEAQGDFEKALGYYKKALQLAPNNREVRANYTRFVEFYQSFKAPEKAKPAKGVLPIPSGAQGVPPKGAKGAAGTPPPAGAPPPPAGAPPPSAEPPAPPPSGEPSHGGRS
jgi:Tetratricopeptide repeat